jgi:lysophospholipase L1-like esterase
MFVSIRRIAVVCSVLVAVPLISSPAIGDTSWDDASPAASARARRQAFASPTLVGPIDHIAVIGDSLYFEDLPPVIRVNTVIPTIRTQLRTRLDDPDFRVRNLSRPGLAIKFPLRSGPFQFISMAEWVPIVLDDPTQPTPDLVVLGANGIDLNIKRTVPIEEIVPELVAEMERVVASIERRGIQVVVVPAFGVNDAMYDYRLSITSGIIVRNNTNARINALNKALSLSDLPMMFAGFGGLDLDYDGDVDEANFVGFGDGQYPDDGVHPNAVGEAILAGHIADHLVEMITDAR